MIINDFAAQAFACRTQAVADAVVIQDGDADDIGIIGVIGAERREDEVGTQSE